MVRNKKPIINGEQKLQAMQRIGDLVARTNIARRLGWQYGDDRKIYQALGYPMDNDLTYSYYWNKYDRQDVATALIDRPVEATWKGKVVIVEEGKKPADSALTKAWTELEETHKIKDRLVKVDKLTGIGQFGILLFGFEDVKKTEDWKTPVTGNRKLLYLRQLGESSVVIETWVKKTSSERYGLPETYKITI